MKVEPTPGHDTVRRLQLSAAACLVVLSIVLFMAGRIWVQGTVSNVTETKTAEERGHYQTKIVLGLFVIDIADADTGSMELVEAAPVALEEGLGRTTLPVTISIDGKEMSLLTAGRTVKELLAEQNIALGKYDRVCPAPTEALKAGLLVRVVRVEKKTVVSTAPIKARTVFRRDYSLERGQSKVVSQGADGVLEKSYVVYTRDGVETLRKQVSRKVAVQPKKKVVAIGTRYSRSSRFTRGYTGEGRMVVMHATGYDPGPGSCGRYADGYTSIGLRAGYGVVAVDPKVIPMRSRLYIEGYGYAIAGDVGGAIKGRRIDLGFDTRREALNFGRRNVKVYIID
ncbi:MAG: 3D domain-containing protein [bacterium]|nr:3D domain-containing protein [bacterium]